MRKMSFRLLLSFALAGIVFASPLAAQQPNSSPDLIRVTVTVEGTKERPNPPAIAKEDIVVFQEKDRRPVVNWVPAAGEGAGLDLAILVDDGLDPSIGVNLDDLRAFVQGQPATTRVAILYASFGTARVLQDFSADHEAAAKKLRLPMGNINSPGSIFMAVSDLMGRWPADDNRHEVLLISDGIDTFYGIRESTPGLNPSLQTAIDKAQRGSVTFFAIYASGTGHFRHSPFLINNGQSCLSRLTDETGGESFFQGFQTPISFKPFLEDLNKLLGQQYLLTFRAALGKKAGFQRLRLRTEQHGVELQAPDQVYIPAAAK